jgi:formate dehydrogenase major subunit
MSNPLADMEKPDTIFCIGTNMTECHPVAATRLKRAKRKGARMIVADPRRIALAEMADLYLPIQIGTDVALLQAMAHVIIRDGLADETFVRERTEGFEAFRAHVADKTPEWAAGICRVPAKDIETAAHWYAEVERAAIYYTLGITEHACGVDNVQSLCNLALLTGNLGREGTGINPMRGQNNIQGAGDSGGVPANFPGFQSVKDPANQAKFEKLWGTKVDLDTKTKVDALSMAGDQIRAMLIVGENTLVSDPDRKHCEHALTSLDHLVVVDIFRTETCDVADVVLPASGFGETEGTCTNTERRVQRVRKAVEPQGEAKPEWWILAEIGRRAGFAGFEYESAEQVFNELCSISPIYAGLDWDTIARGEFQWPVPEKGHPGTPVLHIGEFKNGRGKFVTPSYRTPVEVTSEEFPVWLTTGRRLQAYHTRTQTGRAAGIEYFLSEESLEVHPDDVAKYGLEDGGWCRMTSPRGSVLIKVRATDKSPRGTVFCSFSFNDVPVNFLTGAGYDPVTQTAELKVSVVKLERAEAPTSPRGAAGMA